VKRVPARLLLVALILAFVLRIDLWWWFDPSLMLGLPIGLTYHVLYSIAVAVLMGFVVRFAWPGAGADGDDKINP
jgi:hypothetical protein